MKLQHKVTLLVFGIILATGIIGGLTALHYERKASVVQFSESSMVLAAALRDSIERDMLLPDRQHIQLSVSSIGSLTGLTEVSIFSAAQKVYASSDPTLIGQTRGDPEVTEALSTGETVSSPAFGYGSPNVSVVFPMLNKPQCYTCHGSDLRVLGAVKIGWDTRSLDTRIREQTLVMLLIGGIAFVVMVTALSFTLRSAVVSPLAKLATSARKLARGDFSSRVEFKGKSEVSTVAHAFNNMADSIQERTEQLQELVKVRGQLLDRLISVQEEERRRIARELHDEISQLLAAIMMDLARAMDALPPEATLARERLEQSRAIASRSLTGLRRMIYDLRPEALDQLGLIPAMRSYVTSRLEAQNIEVTLTFHGRRERLSPQLEVAVFRVVQEAVTNILRHAGATKVNIELKANDVDVTVTVEDNGRGFDVQQALLKGDSWGLRGIRERAAVVHGELSIESRPGKGTRLKLRVPYQEVKG